MIRLRAARHGDLAPLVKLLCTPSICVGLLGSAASDERVTTCVHEALPFDSHFAAYSWVAIASSAGHGVPKLVGYAASDAYRTVSFAVHPDFGRRGLAVRLLREVCSAAFSASDDSLTAHVLRDNRASVAVLERCGFHFDGLDHRPVEGHRLPVPVLCYTRRPMDAFKSST